MFTKFNVTNIIIATCIALLVLAGFVLSLKARQNQTCSNIDIQLITNNEGHFITKTVVQKLLTQNGNKPILDKKFNLLNLGQLERQILANKLVKSCQVSKSVGNTLLVKVEEEEPIARIVPLVQNGSAFEGLYLNAEGRIFPLSAQFTKKVMLVSGPYFVGKKHLKNKKDKELLKFLEQVYKDKFWAANIAHVLVAQNQNIVFEPIIGDVLIEYGLPKEDEFEEKFDKIKLYYSKIGSKYGSRYRQVSVKYKGQIVCKVNNETTNKSDSLKVN